MKIERNLSQKHSELKPHKQIVYEKIFYENGKSNIYKYYLNFIIILLKSWTILYMLLVIWCCKNRFKRLGVKGCLRPSYKKEF